jgi:DNA-directed RNA polymerase subunit RPC12/RpoP
MSFEGYYQFLCKKGHNWDEDCYAIEPEEAKCPTCKEKVKWWNLVDHTNGSFDDDGVTRIDGYIELKVDKLIKCEHCGSTISVTYEIPKKGGHVEK